VLCVVCVYFNNRGGARWFHDALRAIKSKEQRTQHSQRDDSSFFKLQSPSLCSAKHLTGQLPANS